nr:immunoglobulin light chain junction region [Macaca mulatta]MOV76236.1 immunoglobulin light chain junction region [Macaca mulatta]
CQQDSTTPLTF